MAPSSTGRLTQATAPQPLAGPVAARPGPGRGPNVPPRGDPRRGPRRGRRPRHVGLDLTGVGLMMLDVAVLYGTLAARVDTPPDPRAAA